jgi:drug/metabolite transporter (DMT)-like permease
MQVPGEHPLQGFVDLAIPFSIRPGHRPRNPRYLSAIERSSAVISIRRISPGETTRVIGYAAAIGMIFCNAEPLGIHRSLFSAVLCSVDVGSEGNQKVVVVGQKVSNYRLISGSSTNRLRDTPVPDDDPLVLNWVGEYDDDADARVATCTFASLWQSLRIHILGVAYCATSISAVLLNKIILARSGRFREFKSVEFLMLLQSIIGVIILFLCDRMNVVNFTLRIDRPRLIRVVFVNVLFVLMTVGSAYSLSWLSLPMVSLLKNCQVVVVCFLEYVFLKNTPGKLTLASLCVIVFGSLCGSVTDLEFNLVGYFWMLVSILSSALYLVSIKVAFRDYHIEEFTLVFYNNLFSIPFFFLSSLSGGMFMHALKYSISGPWVLWLLILISGFAGGGVNITTYLFVTAASPTSFSVLGVIKKVAQTLLGYLTWSAPTNIGNIASVCVGVIGGVAYSVARKMEQKREGPADVPLEMDPPGKKREAALDHKL